MLRQLYTSTTGIPRAMAAQYTRIDGLRQTAGGLLRPPGGAAAVAAGARQLHPSRARRRPVGAHPCALVRAALPLRAPGRDRPGRAAPATGRGVAGPGCQFRAQERGPDLGPGLVLERHGPRGARQGLEVSLLAVVDVAAGSAYLLCARPTPSRREACGAATGRATTVDVGLALLREALAAGAREMLRVRWVVADGGYSTRTFVEEVRWACTRWGGCARTGSCAFATPGPTHGDRVASGSSMVASTAATGRA